MNKSDSTQNSQDDFKHLPYYTALKDYGTEKFISFGTLTHKHPTPASIQINRFKTLMDCIGSQNHSFGRRLHWIVRVEGGHDEMGKRSEEETRTHLHFLLARHKVNNGHHHQFTKEDACSFLERNWEYGRSEVKPYDPSRDGLGYVLKVPHGAKSKEWDDAVVISPALLTFLKNKKSAEPDDGKPWSVSSEPIANEIIFTLRKKGTLCGVGSDMERLRAMAKRRKAAA